MSVKSINIYAACLIYKQTVLIRQFASFGFTVKDIKKYIDQYLETNLCTLAERQTCWNVGRR